MNWTCSTQHLESETVLMSEAVFRPWETMECSARAGDATPATYLEIPHRAQHSSCHSISGSSGLSPIRHLEGFARNYSYPQTFYPSITFGFEDRSRDDHLTSETILYNFAPSTYWQEYVKTYWHLRTMQVMHEWSKEAVYYKNLDCNEPYDLSLPKKNRSTLSSPMAARLHLQSSKNDKGVAKQNYPPTDNRRRIYKRTVFSQKQLRKLTRVFKISKYISVKQRHSLAQQLGVSGTVVSNWFHNQRMKLTRLLSK